MAITEAPPPAAAPGPDEEHAPGDKEMTLLEHLEELRGRLVAMVLAVVVGVLVSVIPVPTMTSVTGFLFGLITGMARESGANVISPGPGAPFFTYLEVSLIVGTGLAMPVIIYQVLAFVSPA